MAFLDAASGLVILLWIVDGLLWVTLFIGTLNRDSSEWWSVAVDIVHSPYPSNACRHTLEIGEEA
jgi:hypothetical protein